MRRILKRVSTNWTNPLVLAALITGCFTFSFHAEAQYREALSGLQFQFIHDAPGATARIGELASLHMIMSSEKGIELRNSYTQGGGKPILFPVRYPSFPGDLYEAVAMMSTGDSASFLIPADSMYLKVFKKPLPLSVKSGENLQFTIKLLEVKSQAESIRKVQEQNEALMKEKADEIAAHQKSEEVEIQQFLDNAGFSDAQKTEEGLYVVLFDEGEGEKIESGQSVIFNYEGTFLDGTTFESSYDIGHPISFTLGQGAVIQGWDLGFQHLKLGASAKLVVPSHLGFGFRGKGDVIPPYTVLVFDVKVVGVK